MHNQVDEIIKGLRNKTFTKLYSNVESNVNADIRDYVQLIVGGDTYLNTRLGGDIFLNIRRYVNMHLMFAETL